MAEAFNSLSNQIVSDSAAAINAGDDLSTVDPSESDLGTTDSRAGQRRRRRADDDDGTEVYDEDDAESIMSQAVNGANGQPVVKAEEEVVLPPHACA